MSPLKHVEMLSIHPDSLLSGLAPSQLVLDIESTGLSSSDRLFMAGLLCPANDHKIQLVQWVIDPNAGEEERELLLILLDEIQGKDILSYNGQAFDFPFLERRSRYWKLSFPDVRIQDPYPFLRKRKKFYSLPNLKLESLEKAAGIHRLDQLSGAEVASYSRLWKDHPEILDRLWLHNKEDLVNLLKLQPYLQELENEASFTLNLDHSYRIVIDGLRKQKDYLHIELRSQTPVFAHFPSQFGQLDLDGKTGQAILPIHQGKLADEVLFLAVSPFFSEDQSPYGMKAPLLPLMDAHRVYLENVKTLLEELVKWGKEGKD